MYCYNWADILTSVSGIEEAADLKNAMADNGGRAV
jgi:hypothetical protein